MFVLFVSLPCFDQDNIENVLLSPLSIYNAFIMTMAGTDGPTKQEMIDTLRVPEHLRGEDAHEAFGSAFKTYFEPLTGVDVSLGNRIFLLQFVNLLNAFRQVVQKCYNADTEAVRLVFGISQATFSSPTVLTWKKNAYTSTNGFLRRPEGKSINL